jgi:hypothetical protein
LYHEGVPQTLTPSLAAADRIGLCATCVHVQRVVSSKGAAFYLCRKSETDDRFPRYPALPVRRCAGYEASPSAD